MFVIAKAIFRNRTWYFLALCRLIQDRQSKKATKEKAGQRNQSPKRKELKLSSEK